MVRRSRPRRSGRVLLALLSLVGTIMALELTVRVLDIPPRPLAPLPVPSYRLSDSALIGYEYRPGYRPGDEPFDPSHRGYAINSDGFRDREYQESKPEGTYRIVVLGDSTTAGNGIPRLERTFVKRLERILNESRPGGGERYEVLNMGVGGYQTLQEIETLRLKGLKYAPDLVIVVFCVNDFDPYADGGVYQVLRERNEYALHSPESVLYRHLLGFSRLAFVVHHRLSALKGRGEPWFAVSVPGNKTPVAAGLSLLSELQRKNGFTAVVAILPEFSSPFHRYRSMPIHEKVFDAAEAFDNISVIDLLPDFAGRDSNARRFSDDGLHLNEYGHVVMADILFRRIGSLPVPTGRGSGSP